MINLILQLTIAISSMVGFSNQSTTKNLSDGIHYELPKEKRKGEIVKHTAYTLNYIEKYEQASWVAYQLTGNNVGGGFERTNKFIEDPLVSTGSASNKDYSKSGYDRGHLAPAADMSWSEESMKESFFFSNMSPQKPEFNRGIWKKLEEQVREWAKDNEKLYIATGPILKGDMETIGPSHVAVPKYYYKAILDYTDPEIKAIGFILPNEGSTEPLKTFAVSVDSLEKATGIDFFYQLPDDVEKKLESKFDASLWRWEKAKKKRSNAASNADTNHTTRF